jgi:RNA polymerase sigma factor (sigma-70 family)
VPPSEAPGPVTGPSASDSNPAMMDERANDDLAETGRAAAAGDRAAAQALLDQIQDDVYSLALRMLGHPADAEDAAQEILIIVLTHLGAFRGDSSLKTWVWRIAANHLARVKRGRRETLSFELLGERLRTGLRETSSDQPGPEEQAMARELRLRCTQGMLLCLDREHRLAYVLGDLFDLSGDEAAQVLEIEPAAFRKRLSRARSRLHAFMRSWCGVYGPANPCRCEGQVACAVERGLLARGELTLSSIGVRPAPALERAAGEVAELMRVAQVIRGPGNALAPQTLVASLRELLQSRRLELLSR